MKLGLEEGEQVTVVEYLELKKRQHGERLRWHHSPNGGLRPSRVDGKGVRFSNEAKKLKAMGTSPGFPDLIVFLLDKSMVRGEVFIVEMKRPKAHPSATSEEQHGWLDFFKAMGYRTRVARGAGEAIEMFKEVGL
jgi:hypothetical protein